MSETAMGLSVLRGKLTSLGAISMWYACSQLGHQHYREILSHSQEQEQNILQWHAIVPWSWLQMIKVWKCDDVVIVYISMSVIFSKRISLSSHNFWSGQRPQVDEECGKHHLVTTSTHGHSLAKQTLAWPSMFGNTASLWANVNPQDLVGNEDENEDENVDENADEMRIYW